VTTDFDLDFLRLPGGMYPRSTVAMINDMRLGRPGHGKWAIRFDTPDAKTPHWHINRAIADGRRFGTHTAHAVGSIAGG
jgi:hypothetical protein